MPSNANPKISSNLDLPADYYLRNFSLLLNWVVERYSDLLSAEEALFAEHFLSMSHGAQCLLVRMVTRKGMYFRLEKLRYPEIVCVKKAALEIASMDFIAANPALELEALGSILTKTELVDCFSDQLGSVKQSRKGMLIEHLHTIYESPACWSDWTNGQFGELVVLHVQPLIDTIIVLFFGNAYQSLTDFVLQDLGLFRYENYTMDDDHRIFQNRIELEQYLLLIGLREAFEALLIEDSGIEMKAIEAIIEHLSFIPANAALTRRHARLCNRIAFVLERREHFDMAISLYLTNTLPPSRERQVRILEKRCEFDLALRLLNDMCKQPQNEHERQVAERMLPRVSKKLGEPQPKKPAVVLVESKTIVPIALKEQGVGVEEATRFTFEKQIDGKQAVETQDRPCFYVENTLFNGLFGLWLWPELYRSVKGAFANPFQIGPLDLYHEDFVRQRPNIQSLLGMLDAGAYVSHCKNTWREKWGISNPFVSWQYLDESLIDLALSIIPAQDLKHIFKRLLFDVKANQSGFPDLIQFDLVNKSYRLIEVKGPGDRLQDNQIRWLNYFAAHNIPAEVCYVEWG